LDTQEIRKAFPNATNIVHCASGELGYQAMFFQALVNHSSKVKPIYEWAERNSRGELEYFTAPVATRNAKRFAPYIAELFMPGAMKPFAVQRAGRELLDPDGQVAVRCPKCDYRLIGLKQLRCPECGMEFTIDELIRAQKFARTTST